MNDFNPFPLEHLPESLRQMAVESADSIGCDVTFTVQPILAAAAWALGAGVLVRPKLGWTETPILWLATVAPSGSAKTPAADEALRPVQDLQQEWVESAGTNLTGPPRRAIVSDITFESLAGLLHDNRHGLLLVVDELAAWFSSFTRYKTGSDAPRWLSLHSAKPLIVDRKTGEPKALSIRRPVISVVGGIQPGILAGLMTEQNRDSGLFARILLAMPPQRVRAWHSDRFVSNATLLAYASAIRSAVLQVEERDTPVEVPFSAAADAKWKRYFDKWQEDQLNLSEYLQAVWSKSVAHAARFSLIVGCYRRIEAGGNVADDWQLTKEDVEAGISIAKWFAREHRRVERVLSGRASEDDLRSHEQWIRSRGGDVSIRDFQNGRNIERSEDALSILRTMEKAGIGWIERRHSGPKGGRPSQRFVLDGGRE